LFGTDQGELCFHFAGQAVITAGPRILPPGPDFAKRSRNCCASRISGAWRLAADRMSRLMFWRLALTSTKSKTAASALGREGAGLYLCQGGTIAIFKRRRMMQPTALVNPGRRTSRRKVDIFNYNNKL
jgi:hypothetical protein